MRSCLVAGSAGLLQPSSCGKRDVRLPHHRSTVLVAWQLIRQQSATRPAPVRCQPNAPHSGSAPSETGRSAFTTFASPRPRPDFGGHDRDSSSIRGASRLPEALAEHLRACMAVLAAAVIAACGAVAVPDAAQALTRPSYDDLSRLHYGRSGAPGSALPNARAAETIAELDKVSETLIRNAGRRCAVRSTAPAQLAC